MDYYKLAKVLKPQGLKGEFKLKPFVDDISRFYDLSHIYLKKNNSYVEYPVEKARTYKQFAYLKVTGIEDCDAAESIRGEYIYIDKAAAKKPEGSHFIADRIGMEVIGTDGTLYGTLKDVMQTGAADIYEIKGKRNFMVPAVPHIVLEINEDKCIITVDSARLDEVAVYD